MTEEFVYKAKNLLDLLVVDLETGKELGTVDGLVFDSETRSLSSIVVRKKSIFPIKRTISFSDVKGIGERSIVVSGKKSLAGRKNKKLSDFADNREVKVFWARVMTISGDELGEVCDVLIDKAGVIKYLEMTKGFILDITKGKQMIPAVSIEKIGRDTVMVHSFVEEFSGSGIDKVSNVLKEIKNKTVKAKEEVEELVGEKEAQFCLGKKTSRTVLGGNKEVIVLKGDIVGEENINLAKTAGKLHELAMATGLSEVEKIRKNIISDKPKGEE